MDGTTGVDTRRLADRARPGEPPTSGIDDVAAHVADAPGPVRSLAIAAADDIQDERVDAISPRSSTVLIGLGLVVAVVILDGTGLLSVPLVLVWLVLLGRSI